jgi:hypothetical protein
VCVEMAWKVPLLLFLAVTTGTDAQGRYDYSSQLTRAVNSLNRLLDYMLEPRSVVGDMIFGVVLARGRYLGLKIGFYSWSGALGHRLASCTSPRMLDDDEYGAVGAVSGRGN